MIVFEKKIPENWIKGVEKLEKIFRPKKVFCLNKFLYVNGKTDRKFVKRFYRKIMKLKHLLFIKLFILYV